MSSIDTMHKLVLEFAENVAAQTEAMKRGDSTTGNKHAKRYIKAFEALRRFGDPGRDALAPLLQDSRVDVCLMAAAYLLRHRHEEARRVLEQIARGQGFHAFAANPALKRWEDKTWQLDPLEPSAHEP
jgi:hypothetical protein